MVEVSPLMARVRVEDPDRFLAILLAPVALREALVVLTAFNHELARAREVASQSLIGLMRLQWWRDVVEGAERRHEVATPLRALLAEGVLAREDLLTMINAREVEADEVIPTLADWTAYLHGTAGGWAVAAGRALGADGALCTRLASLGAAYGAAGVLRNIAAHARQGRCLLPADVLEQAGTDHHAVIAGKADAALPGVVAQLAELARGWLAEGAGPIPRGAIAAALPSVLARRDLARIEVFQPCPRGIGDRLAVLAAWARGRV